LTKLAAPFICSFLPYAPIDTCTRLILALTRIRA
jgi:hypothetical protein